MDAHAAQLRHQIDETRAAMDAQLTQLEQRVSQMPAALLEQHVLGPVRGVQETAARATTWLHQYPWLIIAAGALVGSQLRRAKSRPVRPVQPPPPRAAVTSPRARPAAAHAMTAVYDARQQPPAPAAAPSTPGEAAKAAPSDPRASCSPQKLWQQYLCGGRLYDANLP
jgi:ElaB/YqjD/DUF883 family membrane-anchored ribosome-binding protein